MRNPIDIDVIIDGVTHNLEVLLEAHFQDLVNGDHEHTLDLSDQDLHHVILTNRDLRNADLRNTNLFNADVMNTDFRGADLRGANIDFAQLNISCKSLSFKVDERQAKMFLYMIMTIMDYSDIDVSDLVTDEMYNYLEDSHLVTEHELVVLVKKNS